MFPKNYVSYVWIELVAHILTPQRVVMTSSYRISGRRQRKIRYGIFKIYNDMRRLNELGAIINFTGFQTFCYDLVKRNF
jgi:ketopantoate hydroxymethyltransferase